MCGGEDVVLGRVREEEGGYKEGYEIKHMARCLERCDDESDYLSLIVCHSSVK